MSGDIPKKTIYRLSLYSRCLDRLGPDEVQTLSSETLAKVAGVKPAQLRKDLACCGQIGKRGRGYDVVQLRALLDSMLKQSHLRPVVLIGVGNLGAALMHYDGFVREGFEIVRAFDLLAGEQQSHRGLEVRPMGELGDFIASRQIRIAILCVPATVAQQVTNQIVNFGIQAILNFAPIVLQVPPQVTVNNVNLAIELESLGYFVR